ncbi:hypothetical protein C0Q70_01215 [Pomacea canaliculata]|uniref:Uncharacterized protein n=1 Tax=Pomacea canaliculata TaxID=400727 RepID=A0A2T7PYW3_POMCA|nr:hypothetical protein C0Q70_01215 [Pomacea canaliculata]
MSRTLDSVVDGDDDAKLSSAGPGGSYTSLLCHCIHKRISLHQCERNTTGLFARSKHLDVKTQVLQKYLATSFIKQHAAKHAGPSRNVRDVTDAGVCPRRTRDKQVSRPSVTSRTPASAWDADRK